MADGNEYNLIQLKERGEPVEAVYPTEGTPQIIGPIGRHEECAQPQRGAPRCRASCSRPSASS